MHIYGQQEVVKDLIAARLSGGGQILFEAEATRVEGIDGERPTIHFRHEGADATLACDFVAGCDGFHGVFRAAFQAVRSPSTSASPVRLARHPVGGAAHHNR